MGALHLEVVVDGGRHSHQQCVVRDKSQHEIISGEGVSDAQYRYWQPRVVEPTARHCQLCHAEDSSEHQDYLNEVQHRIFRRWNSYYGADRSQCVI